MTLFEGKHFVLVIDFLEWGIPLYLYFDPEFWSICFLCFTLDYWYAEEVV